MDDLRLLERQILINSEDLMAHIKLVIAEQRQGNSRIDSNCSCLWSWDHCAVHKDEPAYSCGYHYLKHGEPGCPACLLGIPN